MQSLNLSLSPLPCHSPAAYQQRRLSTSRPPPPQVSHLEFGRRNCIVRSGGILSGRPISRLLPKCLSRSARVTCYLHDSEKSPAVKEDEETTSPGPLPHSKAGTPPVALGSGVATPTPTRRIGLDPFRGKSGSVSFCGLTHQALERRNLVSTPFNEGTGSLLWVLGPLALVSSLMLPQLFLGVALEGLLKDEILADIFGLLFSEFIFYAGLAAFLSVTDKVQRPFLEFSAKNWSLITGLKGYMSTAFFVMGFKVFAPVLAAYVVWPVIGLPALIAVVPFLLGCAAQFAFELYLNRRNSSCWPTLPILFEVYRLYQLNKAAYFIQKLLYSMGGSSMTRTIVERSNALVSMLAVFQILGVFCLWSLTTFLLRLFPSRPVAENY